MEHAVGTARGPLPGAFWRDCVASRKRLSLPRNSTGEGRGALRAGWFCVAKAAV